LSIFLIYIFWALLIFSPSSNPDEDYTVLISAIIFPILVLIQNVIAAVINNVKFTYGLVIVATGAYALSFIDVITSASFKSGICLAFGIFVLSIKTKIDSQLQQGST